MNTPKFDTIIWKCPYTKMYIKAPRIDGIRLEYSVYCADDSFVDSDENYYAALRIGKEIDKRFDPVKIGKIDVK